MPSKSKEHLRPIAGAVPFTSESPGVEVTKLLLRAASYGLGPAAASSYAGVPTSLVNNWLARGMKLAAEPFDPTVYDDPVVRKHHVEFHRRVGIPCMFLFTEWRKAKAEFAVTCIRKIKQSKDWKALAWLLERQDPSRFAPPARSQSIRRDKDSDEEIIEAAVADERDLDNVPRVTFYCPDNGRASDAT